MPRFKVTYVDYVDAVNEGAALWIAEAAVKEDIVFAENAVVEREDEDGRTGS